MKSLDFPSSENVFIWPSLLRGIFMRYGILSWQFFSCCPPWLLWEIFSQSNSYSLTRHVSFSLAAFKISSLPFIFRWIMMGFTWIHPVCCSLSFLNPQICLNWIGKFSVIIPSKIIIFSIPVSSSSPQGSSNKHIRPVHIVSWILRVCSTCFNLLSVCFSDQITSIYPSSTQWTLFGHLCIFEDRLQLFESLWFFILDNVFHSTILLGSLVMVSDSLKRTSHSFQKCSLLAHRKWL